MNVARTQEASENGLRIVKLSISNVKRIRCVEITPAGDMVVVGGKNGAGKSSVLDSIQYTLAGKGSHPRRPVREGEEKGEVLLDLGEFKVRRTFTPSGGGSLVVENKDGARYPSPQAWLDGLIGKGLALDPLAFTRMGPAQQAESVRQIAGLDLADIDDERACTYAERTDVNREVKRLAGQLASLPHHEDAPAQEVDPAEVLGELEKAQAHNRSNEALRSQVVVTGHELVEAVRLVDRSREAERELEDRIAELQRQLDAQRGKTVEYSKAVEAKHADIARAKVEAEKAKDVDVEPIRARLQGLEAENRKVRENLQREAVRKEHEARAKESADLTAAISALDVQRQKRIAEAAMPVKGLGFDEDGYLTFGGVPFDQCSSAEQLRVSVAIAAAANPRLRVLLVRDGSLLDDDSMRLLSQLAREHGLQPWIERVEDDEHTSLVLEDGSVRGAEVGAAAKGGAS